MQSKVDMILETLPTSYNQFKLNYNMNKLNMDLTELMQELQDAQFIMKSKNYVHFAQASTSRPNLKGNKSKRKQKQTKGKGKKKLARLHKQQGLSPKVNALSADRKGTGRRTALSSWPIARKKEEATK